MDVGVGETTTSCLCNGSTNYLDISATFSSALDALAAVRRLIMLLLNFLKDSPGVTVCSCTIDVSNLNNFEVMTECSCCNRILEDTDSLRI